MPAPVIRKTEEAAIDLVNVAVGVCLALSPWALGFSGETHAAWSAWILGVAIAAVALGAFMAFHAWEEWVNLVLGLAALIAPWALGFAAVTRAATTALVVAGVLVAVLAAVELWYAHHRPMSSA